MKSDLLKISLGFDREAAEAVARAGDGFVTCDTYGPSRNLHDWAALVPCEWTGPATDRALAAAREVAPAAKLATGRVRIRPHAMPDFHYRPDGGDDA